MCFAFCEMTLAPHFLTSLAVFNLIDRKTAGDVIVAAPRITSLSKNEIKWRVRPRRTFDWSGGWLMMSKKISFFALLAYLFTEGEH